MIKLIGAILICGGAAAVGLTASGRLSLRIRVLTALTNALDIMHAEIGTMLTPLDELLTGIKNTVGAPVNQLFSQCSQRFQNDPDIPFSLIWTRSVREADYLELTKQEQQMLIEMGASLGRYDAEEQARLIAHTRRGLELRLRSAEAEKQRTGKLYGGLGIICGVVLVIVFL